jgi:hypothetical protein
VLKSLLLRHNTGRRRGWQRPDLLRKIIGRKPRMGEDETSISITVLFEEAFVVALIITNPLS